MIPAPTLILLWQSTLSYICLLVQCPYKTVMTSSSDQARWITRVNWTLKSRKKWNMRRFCIWKVHFELKRTQISNISAKRFETFLALWKWYVIFMYFNRTGGKLTVKINKKCVKMIVFKTTSLFFGALLHLKYNNVRSMQYNL